MKSLFGWALIIFTGVLVFSPSFITSMHGDEWKVIWLARHALEAHGNYLPVNSWDAPYFFELATLEPLSKIFPLHSGLFYVFHFALRLATAVYLFFFVSNLTKSKVSAYVASFLFLISPVGIEAYTWTRNYSSYFGIVIILHSYLFFIKKQLKPLHLLLAFISIIIINTTRSHGALLFLSAVLFTEAITNKNSKYTYTLISLFLIFFLAAQSKYFGGQAGHLFENFQLKLFLTNLTANIGKVLVSATDYMRISFLAMFALLIIWKKELQPKGVLLGLTITGAFTFLYSYTVQTETYRSLMFAVIILVFLTTTIYKDFKNTALILGLSISWLVIPMIRQPNVVMGNDHRYIIYSALVIPLIAAFAIRKSSIVIIPICLLSFVFARQTFNTLTSHKNSHSTAFNNYIWREISKKVDPQTYYNSDKIILIADTQNHPAVGASVYFGSQYHFALIYNDYRPEENLPPTYFFHGFDSAKSELKGNYILINISQK